MDVESTMLPLGTKMPNFNLLGIDGDMYTNEMFDDKKGSLIMFICNHCPFVKHFNDEVVNLTNEIIKDNSNFCFFGENNPWITTKIQLKKIHRKIFNIINTYHIKNPYFNGIIFDQLNQNLELYLLHLMTFFKYLYYIYFYFQHCLKQLTQIYL